MLPQRRTMHSSLATRKLRLTTFHELPSGPRGPCTAITEWVKHSRCPTLICSHEARVKCISESPRRLVSSQITLPLSLITKLARRFGAFDWKMVKKGALQQPWRASWVIKAARRRPSTGVRQVHHDGDQDRWTQALLRQHFWTRIIHADQYCLLYILYIHIPIAKGKWVRR